MTSRDGFDGQNATTFEGLAWRTLMLTDETGIAEGSSRAESTFADWFSRSKSVRPVAVPAATRSLAADEFDQANVRKDGSSAQTASVLAWPVEDHSKSLISFEPETAKRRSPEGLQSI